MINLAQRIFLIVLLDCTIKTKKLFSYISVKKSESENIVWLFNNTDKRSAAFIKLACKNIFLEWI